MMQHRYYRGRVSYITDEVGEMGREWFHVTIQPDGTRTMRATCEMDDDRLLRDAVMTVDKDWYPVDAFVRLTVEEQLVGSSWFNFSEHHAECEGVIAAEGRFSQRIDTQSRAGFLGAHPVHGDAWACATLQRTTAPGEQNFSTSHMPNGGSGPKLVPTPIEYAYKKYVKDEPIEVPAGRFETKHFQFFVGEYPPIDIWTYGSDYIPVRLRWDLLKQSYELMELEGDPV